MSTPAHIVPEWYFLPFYAILRSIPDKLGGVVAMVSAILVLLLLPILNTSLIRSSKFRPIFALSYWFLFADFVILGWIGQKPVETPYIEIGMFATFFYFLFLIILVPSLEILEESLIKNKNIYIKNIIGDIKMLVLAIITKKIEKNQISKKKKIIKTKI